MTIRVTKQTFFEVSKVTAALIQTCSFLCVWPNFRIKPSHHPRRVPPSSKSTPAALSSHIFTPSNTLSPWHATAFLYHLRLSALGAADKINIRSTQFSSLIRPTQSAKARRVSILLCCIYFICHISTLSIPLRLHLSPHILLLPSFLGTNLSLTYFLFHFLPLPSFPLGGSTFLR